MYKFLKVHADTCGIDLSDQNLVHYPTEDLMGIFGNESNS